MKILTYMIPTWMLVYCGVCWDIDTQIQIVVAFQQYFLSRCVTLLYSPSMANVEFSLWRQLSLRGIQTSALPLSNLNSPTISESCPRPLAVLKACDRDLLQLSQKRILPCSLRWIVFLGDISPHHLLENIYIPFDCELVTVKADINGGAIFTEFYQPSAESPLQAHLWGRWSPVFGLVGPAWSFRQRRNDLKGATLKAVIKKYEPLLLVGESNGNPIPTGGYFGEVWKILERKLNCTTQYFTPPDDQWGEPSGNQSWTGIVGLVQRGEADVALSGYSLLPDRAEVVHFSQPILSSSDYVFVRPTGSLGAGWGGFLTPFQMKLWLVVLAIIPAASVCLRLFFSCLKEGDPHERWKLSESVYVVLAIFCMQGQHMSPRQQPCLVFFWSLYFTAIVVSTAYSSSLVAFLSITKLNLPFTTFEELLEDGSYQLGVLAQGSHLSFFKSARYPPFSTAYSQLIAPTLKDLPTTQTQGLRRLCSRPRYCYYATEQIIQRKLSMLPCEVYKLPKTTVTTQIALIHPKRSPYNAIIGRHVEELRRSGILRMLYLRTWPASSDVTSNVHKLRGVNLEVVAAFFAIIMAGAVIGFIILLGEKYLHHL